MHSHFFPVGWSIMGQWMAVFWFYFYLFIYSFIHSFIHLFTGIKITHSYLTNPPPAISFTKTGACGNSGQQSLHHINIFERWWGLNCFSRPCTQTHNFIGWIVLQTLFFTGFKLPALISTHRQKSSQSSTNCLCEDNGVKRSSHIQWTPAQWTDGSRSSLAATVQKSGGCYSSRLLPVVSDSHVDLSHMAGLLGCTISHV